MLEYDVFNPTEVIPEFTADVGMKRGEKVDYAIMREGKPIILFECKRYGADLERGQASQLYRYFNVTNARFGVLTDGVRYQFFSDLDQPNIMDSRPFLEFSLRDFEDAIVDELKKFTKPSFDLEEILATASDLMYTKEIRRILAEQWATPNDEFVGFFVSRVYPGHKKTRSVIDRFREVTRRALQQFIRDRISDRLKYALAEENGRAPGEDKEEPGTQDAAEPEEGRKDKRIVTTAEEIEGYYVVKAVLRGTVDVRRVFMRDMVTQCGVLLDDTLRKPICRFYFESAQMYLGLIDQQKREERVPIDSVDDIYNYADRLVATLGYYGG